jgi:Tfp pilus assembly protein PilF
LLYFNQGAVFLNLGQRKEAREAFEASLRLQPQQPEVQRLLEGLKHGR